MEEANEGGREREMKKEENREEMRGTKWKGGRGKGEGEGREEIVLFRMIKRILPEVEESRQ